MVVAIAWGLVPGEARAQSDGGLYLSHELGIHLAPSLGIDADAANAPGSICDQHLNPFTGLMPAFCSAPDAPDTVWTNTFGGAGGLLAGGAVGYRFRDAGGLRVELEYFFRETVHNETSPIEGRGGVAVAKLDGEVVVAEDRIGSVTSHNLFGNLYFDFSNRSRVTPYVGFGAGFGSTAIDYGLLWVRNDEPSMITSVAPYFPDDHLDDLRVLQQNLASTTSSTQTEFADRLFGYQVLFGLDYGVTESVSIGVKGRWVAFGAFSDRGILDRLRSHIPSNQLDGSDPVTIGLTTGDIAMFGVGLNLKYQF